MGLLVDIVVLKNGGLHLVVITSILIAHCCIGQLCHLTEIKKRSVNELDVLKELPPSKRGRPLLIGETLDKQVREYLQELRDRGGVINTAVALGCGAEPRSYFAG